MKHAHLKKYIYIGLTIFIALSLCILLYFLLDRMPQIMTAISTILSIIKPLIYGAAIAYVLYPVCVFFEKIIRKLFSKLKNRKLANKLIRGISIFLSLIFGIGIIVAILYLILPQIYKTIETIINESGNYINNITVFVSKKLSDNPELSNSIVENIKNYSDKITSLLSNVLPVLEGIKTGIVSIAVAAKNIFIGIIVAIYLLADRHQFKNGLKRFIELIFSTKMASAVKSEIKFANNIFLGFISGKILDSAIIGVLCYILMIILGLPFAPLIAVLIAVTNLIPFFGPFIGAIPSALLILIDDPWKCLIFIIMIIVLQQLDGNVIGPKILGDSTGLSSFWVLFSILVFGGLFGFTGMIIGVPVFAIIYDIVKKIIIKCEEKRKLKSESE